MPGGLFYLIQKLNTQHRDGGYKRALHLALRMLFPYHSSLPAPAFVEEKGGGVLLCRLTWEVGEDTTINSVDDYHHALFTRHHQQPSTWKPLTSPRITRESIRAVSMHLTRLLACIHLITMPFAKKMATRPRPGARAANTLHATMQWPENLSLSPCFNTQVADATFLYGACRSLNVLFFCETRAES